MIVKSPGWRWDGVRGCGVSSILFAKTVSAPWREHLIAFYSNDMLLSSTTNSLLLNELWLHLNTLFSCKTASSKNEILAVSTKIMCTSAVLSETGSPY